MSGVGKLLKQFTMDTGISQKDVAARLDFSPQRVNNYYRDISDPPFDFYEKFRTEFNVDLKKLLDKESKGIANGTTSYNPLPVYDLDLKPVKGLDFFNYSELVSYYMDAPLYNDCFAFVRVPGVAMSPAFNPSDVIAVKKVTNFETAPLGEPYFIITDEQRLLRYVRANENKKCFTLKAVNSDFDDMEIKKSDIKFLFQIKGKMTRL
ncbi:MAG: S24 family peptidase [Ferruginibacter sp.]